MLFTTLKSDVDGELIIAPNSKLVSSSIKRQSEYNMFEIEVSYKSETHFEKTKEIKLLLQKELILNKYVLSVPAPDIKLVSGENSFALYLRVWTQEKHKEHTKKDIDSIVKKIFAKYNLTIGQN